MNKLAMFAFVKNENDIIQYFIDYHLNIFDEITIIDNGSTDGTYEILQTYAKNIVLIKNESHFNEKGNICTELMKRSNCDILVPLDADEIIIYDNNEIKIKNAKKVKNYLQELKINDKKYIINKIYNQYPDRKTYWQINTNPNKMIFSRKTFVFTDCGFHVGMTTSDKYPNREAEKLDISYLHFHFRNKDIWLKNTEQKLKARLGNNWNNIEILKKYDGRSVHLAKAMVMYLETGEWNNLIESHKTYYDFDTMDEQISD